MARKVAFHPRAVWLALDQLAEDNGMSPSALAIKAGFHATAFNPSKRIEYGRWRSVNMDTISRVLAVVDMTIDDFAKMVKKHDRGCKND